MPNELINFPLAGDLFVLDGALGARGENLRGAVTVVVEWLVHSRSHGQDVLLEDTGLFHEILVDLSAGQVFVAVAQEVGEMGNISDVVAVFVVHARGDGVGGHGLSAGGGKDLETSRIGAAGPVFGEGLVTEERSDLGSRDGVVKAAISQKVQSESDLAEGGGLTGNVVFQLGVPSLVQQEGIVLEFSKDLVVEDGVFALRTIVSEFSGVEQENVEHVVLEVDVVALADVAAGHGDVAFETSVGRKTACYGTVEAAWDGRDLVTGMADRQHSQVRVTAHHRGETGKEASKVMFHVETGHDTFDDLLSLAEAIAGNVPVVCQRVQGGARSTGVAWARSNVWMGSIGTRFRASVLGVSWEDELARFLVCPRAFLLVLHTLQVFSDHFRGGTGKCQGCGGYSQCCQSGKAHDGLRRVVRQY
jgi:hypothetical protein